MASLKNQGGKPWGKPVKNLIFSMVLLISTKTGGQGKVALVYSRNLKVNFWNIEK